MSNVKTLQDLDTEERAGVLIDMLVENNKKLEEKYDDAMCDNSALERIVKETADECARLKNKVKILESKPGTKEAMSKLGDKMINYLNRKEKKSEQEIKQKKEERYNHYKKKYAL